MKSLGPWTLVHKDQAASKPKREEFQIARLKGWYELLSTLGSPGDIGGNENGNFYYNGELNGQAHGKHEAAGYIWPTRGPLRVDIGILF